MNDHDRSGLRTKVAVKNQQRALSHLHLVNQGALNVPTLIGTQKNVNLPSIAKKNMRHQQQTPASQSIEARNQYWSGSSQNNISKSNLKGGKNHFSNYSQNLLSKESSTKMPKMSSATTVGRRVTSRSIAASAWQTWQRRSSRVTHSRQMP